MSMPEDTPAAVTYLPSVTTRSPVGSAPWCFRWSRAGQWEVARRPLRRPAVLRHACRGVEEVPAVHPAGAAGERKGRHVFRAIADVLRQIGGAIATVVTLPFRALARLFGGASSTARGRRA